MGVMYKFLNYMKLNPDDDYEYVDDDYYDDDDEEETPAPKKAVFSREDSEPESRPVKKAASNKVTSIRSVGGSRNLSADGMQVCVIKPTSVEDGREITETLLANRTVVLNLEGLEVDIAQRIIDFTSGSCYAISGNLQKISHYIFIVTPPSVDISGDFQEILSGSFDVPINK